MLWNWSNEFALERPKNEGQAHCYESLMAEKLLGRIRYSQILRIPNNWSACRLQFANTKGRLLLPKQRIFPSTCVLGLFPSTLTVPSDAREHATKVGRKTRARVVMLGSALRQKVACFPTLACAFPFYFWCEHLSALCRQIVSAHCVSRTTTNTGFMLQL